MGSGHKAGKEVLGLFFFFLQSGSKWGLDRGRKLATPTCLLGVFTV